MQHFARVIKRAIFIFMIGKMSTNFINYFTVSFSNKLQNNYHLASNLLPHYLVKS